MAIAVNTWAEFLAAYESASDTVIELMADIDANDNLPDKFYYRPVSKTINGNGHTIYNISTQAVLNNPIFRADGGSALIFSNCNLYNCYRIENHPIFWSSDTYRVQFQDCKITGRGLQHIAERATFQRSSYSWSGIKTSSVGKLLSFINSWVKIDAALTATSTGDGFAGGLNNSYLEGTVTYTSETFNLKVCNSVDSSVVNLTTTATSANFPSGNTSVYNSTKAPNFADAGAFIGVTDSQLKSANYLSSIGFNIVT